MMLLNDFLPVRITGIDKIEYDPNESDIFKGGDRQVIMDVICHTDTEQIIVEMQKSNSNEFRNRMAYYGGSMIARQLKRGDKYGKLKPVYVICFMNFRLIHQTDQLVYRYQLRERDSQELYGDQLSIYLCELPRFAKSQEESLTPEEEWFEILQNMTIFASRPLNVGKRFDSLLNDCRQNLLEVEEQEQYFSAMISEHEKQSIAAAYKEEGFREGMEKTKIDMAKAMKLKGLSEEVICEICGLDKETVARL